MGATCRIDCERCPAAVRCGRTPNFCLLGQCDDCRDDPLLRMEVRQALIDELGGLDLTWPRPVTHHRPAELPVHLPILVQAYADEVDIPWVAIHGGRLLGAKAELTPKHRQRPLCDVYRLGPSTRLVLELYVEDRVLEGVWARRARVIEDLAELGFDLVLAPNLSVWRDAPRMCVIWNEGALTPGPAGTSGNGCCLLTYSGQGKQHALSKGVVIAPDDELVGRADISAVGEVDRESIDLCADACVPWLWIRRQNLCVLQCRTGRPVDLDCLIQVPPRDRDHLTVTRVGAQGKPTIGSEQAVQALAIVCIPSAHKLVDQRVELLVVFGDARRFGKRSVCRGPGRRGGPCGTTALTSNDGRGQQDCEKGNGRHDVLSPPPRAPASLRRYTTLAHPAGRHDQQPRPRPALRLNRDDLGEAEPVNLPGVAARRGDVRFRRPRAPRSSGWGTGLDEVQLPIQVESTDVLDRLAQPVVVKRPAEENVPIAIELAAANSDGSRIRRVGDPENLVTGRRTAFDPLTGDCVYGAVTQTHPETPRIRLPEGGLRACLSGGEPTQLDWTRGQVAPVSCCGDSSLRRCLHSSLGGFWSRLRADAARPRVATRAHGEHRGKEQDWQHRPSHVDIHTSSTRLRFHLPPRNVFSAGITPILVPLGVPQACRSQPVHHLGRSAAERNAQGPTYGALAS